MAREDAFLQQETLKKRGNIALFASLISFFLVFTTFSGGTTKPSTFIFVGIAVIFGFVSWRCERAANKLIADWRKDSTPN